ncbi:MAG: hypothetical protein QXS55_00890 [Candidatus Woesearchaeota archaeon]
MRAEITISAIFGGLTAVLAIVLLISFFSFQMPVFAKQVYCKTFFYVASASFLPSGIRQSSDYCREFSMLHFIEVKPIRVFVKRFADNSTTFTSNGESTFYFILPINSTLTGFSFSARAESGSAEFYICGSKNADWQIEGAVPSKYYTSPGSLVKNLAECSSKCKAYPCILNVSVRSSGKVWIKDLSLTYKDCPLLEAIAASTISCWESANFGSYSENIPCAAILIRNCPPLNINESTLTKYLRDNGLCGAISNLDYECGDSDDIEWNLTSIHPQGSILIEFLNNSKKIRIS